MQPLAAKTPVLSVCALGQVLHGDSDSGKPAVSTSSTEVVLYPLLTVGWIFESLNPCFSIITGDLEACKSNYVHLGFLRVWQQNLFSKERIRINFVELLVTKKGHHIDQWPFWRFSGPLFCMSLFVAEDTLLWKNPEMLNRPVLIDTRDGWKVSWSKMRISSKNSHDSHLLVSFSCLSAKAVILCLFIIFNIKSYTKHI